MKYIDVILPLPLDGTFTYAVGDDQSSAIAMGVRVLVPFGPSKTYTALCTGEAHDGVEGVDADKVKTIIGVVDGHPMLLPSQMSLCRWMSDYYMSPLGDVFTAAMPAGLKREEGYKPRTEVCVALGKDYQNVRALHVALDMLRRAAKQQQVLSAFLALSGWDKMSETTPRPPVTEVTREVLLNETHATQAVVKALCDRHILCTYDREVGRLNRDGDYRPDMVNP